MKRTQQLIHVKFQMHNLNKSVHITTRKRGYITLILLIVILYNEEIVYTFQCLDSFMKNIDREKICKKKKKRQAIKYSTTIESFRIAPYLYLKT